MSAWPETASQPPLLASPEGELKSVHITVDPRMLEELLEALSQLSFPINPQIHHQATSRQETRPVTVVEFPAYAGRVADVRAALVRGGFPEGSLSVTGVLEDLRRAAPRG